MRRELTSDELLDANDPQQNKAYRNNQYRRGLVELLSANAADSLEYFERASQHMRARRNIGARRAAR